MERKIITLTSDFGKQTQGIAGMEGAIFGINPDARVIHLMHGIPGFDIFTAARTMETAAYLPAGFHVCVVDPGVGTGRKAIIVKAKRGDCLIGPDNGCLMAAPRFLGGIEKIVEISNEKYMLTPVSPVFHGRHIFAPAAAHLSLGVPLEEFGGKLAPEDCVRAPYEEAVAGKDRIEAAAIHVNHFGSVHLNIMHKEWDRLGVRLGEEVELSFGRRRIKMPFARTFGDVGKGEPLIMKDDYGRMEVALNLGNFAEKYPAKAGDTIIVRRP